MANTFACTLEQLLTCVETFDDNSLGADNTLTHSLFNLAPLSLNAGTTPAVTAIAYGEYTLTSGAATINLAAAVHTALGTTVNATGKKIVAMLIKAPSTNGAAITIAKGASSGHTGLGSSFSLKFSPTDTAEIYKFTNGVTVGSGDRTFDLAGTGSSDKLQIGFLFGG